MKKTITGILGVALLCAGVLADCFLSGECQATVNEAGKASKKASTKQILWLTSLNAAIAESKRTDKPILADFYAEWCPPCKMMTTQTFPDAKVIAESKKWVMLKVDTDKHPNLAEKYRISSLPTTAVLKSDGRPVTGAMGFLSSNELVKMMRETHAQASPKK